MSFRVDREVTDADGTSLWPVYDAVFGDQPDYDTWRGAVWDRHRGRDGFRLARACAGAGAGAGDTLVGFAYGYTGEHGQWWTDNAAKVLDPRTATTWLGGHFELVSIGVLASERQGGIGRRLMHALLDGLPQERLLLMTSADPSDPARRLYASEGWQVLGPGIGDGQVIMGRHNAPLTT